MIGEEVYKKKEGTLKRESRQKRRKEKAEY